MGHEDEAIELGRIAWAQVERVLGIADPVLLGHLHNGGDFWADARTAPPSVGFSFDQADTERTSASAPRRSLRSRATARSAPGTPAAGRSRSSTRRSPRITRT